MARTIHAALEHALELLSDPYQGLPARLSEISSRDHVPLAPITGRSMALLNAANDLMDQARDARYPQLLLFAEQMDNQQREKFAYFAGVLRLAAEVRLSSDSLDKMEENLHRYVEAVINVVHSADPRWSDDTTYTGRYSVNYSPVRAGGHNFIQSARISFAVDQFVAA